MSSLSPFEIYAAAKNRGALDEAIAVWDEEAKLHLVPFDLRFEGKAEVRAAFEVLLSAFAEYEGVVDRVIDDEQSVVAWWRLTGTHEAPLLGLDATGRSVDLPMVSVFDVRNDRLVSEAVYFKAAELADQLGVDVATLSAGVGAVTAVDRPDHEGFMRRFRKAWGTRSPDDFAEVFHQTGTVYHPTMERPAAGSELWDYFDRLRTVAPDVHLSVDRWTARGSIVMIEWSMRARYGSEELAWNGMDRFTILGDRAVEGIAYFDTLALWAILDPTMRRGPMAEVLSTGSTGATISG